ncbi:MAG: recombinase family protein [Candidatus Acidiferrales bacterium]
MKNEKLIALYARVSTSNHGQDPAMQIRELREYSRLRGWKIYDEYIDRGISGTKESRPELNRLLSDAHRRRFDVVGVWKFDRFARSVSHLLRALDAFRALRIDFVSVTEQIDTSTAAGAMVFTVLAACAALEVSLISERVKAGLRNAKANGKKLGRPPLRELGTPEIRRLRQERRKGASFKALAQSHGVSVWTAFYLCKAKA